MYPAFLKFVNKNYPYWGEVFNDYPPSQNAISPAVIKLDHKLFKKMQDLVSTMYKLRNSMAYQQAIFKDNEHLDTSKHFAVQSCFDLHIENDEPKLLEINTNASFLILSHLLTEFNNLPSLNKNIFPNLIDDVKRSFEEDWVIFNPNKKLQHITILDENPKGERAFFEFLMFKKLFESWGYICEIQKVSDLKYKNNQLYTAKGNITDFIYNRYTDFLLQRESSKDLLEAYINSAACFSPHPREYLLLTDKGRFIQWNDDALLSACGLTEKELARIKLSIPKTYTANDTNKDWLWEQRKKLFFKPQRSHGGKGAYKGASITKKKFSEIFKEDYIAQEFVAPMYIELNNTELDNPKFKYDYRLYTYGGRIQYISARLFQGQTTNFKAPGGGIAPVYIVNT